MAEYSANAAQTILPGASAIFTATPVPDTTGYIYHRDESGVFRLASPARIVGRCFTGCKCNRRMLSALYGAALHGNISIPTGGTVGEISIAIAIDGIADPSSLMIVTPAATGDFFNVGADIAVAVPSICGCETVSVINASDQPIVLQNANFKLDYERIIS